MMSSGIWCVDSTFYLTVIYLLMLPFEESICHSHVGTEVCSASLEKSPLLNITVFLEIKNKD